MRLFLTHILSALLLLVVAGLFLATRTGAVAAIPAGIFAQDKPSQPELQSPLAPSTLCSSFSNYLVYTNTGVSLVPGTLDIGNHTDDGVTNIALPFPSRSTTRPLARSTLPPTVTSNSPAPALSSLISACPIPSPTSLSSRTGTI